MNSEGYRAENPSRSRAGINSAAARRLIENMAAEAELPEQERRRRLELRARFESEPHAPTLTGFKASLRKLLQNKNCRF